MYSILITVSISSVIQSSFICYLWWKIMRDNPLDMLTHQMPIATIPSAPLIKRNITCEGHPEAGYDATY